MIACAALHTMVIKYVFDNSIEAPAAVLLMTSMFQTLSGERSCGNRFARVCERFDVKASENEKNDGDLHLKLE